MFRLLPQTRARWAAVFWGVGALACTDLASPGDLSAGLGGQSGDGSGNHGGQTGDGAGIAKIGVVQCPHKSTVWQGALDDVVPELELSPEDVLNDIENSIEDSLGWVANERLKLAPGQSEVGVELRYEGGQIRVRKADNDLEADREQGADLAPTASYVSRASQYCGTVLELEVAAHLFTADGLLDETFPVIVSANQRGAAHFEGWLPKKLQGSLQAHVSQAQSRLYVASVLTPLGSSGEIVVISKGNPNEEAPPAERIAAWPVLDPHVCGGAGYDTVLSSITPSTDRGAVRSHFESLAPGGELPLAWSRTPAWPEVCSPDTSSLPQCQTTLLIETRDVPDTWCVSASPFDASFIAVAPVTVAVSTSDEQWRGQYTASATVAAFADGSLNVGLSVFETRVVNSARELGFPNVRLEQQSQASLGFDIFRTLDGTVGHMSVFGQAASASTTDAGAPEPGASEVIVAGSVGQAP